MPDILTQLPDLNGLALLVLAAVVSGVVRGFSGFGTAMIFLPVAALVVDPIWAILAMTGMDILGPLPAVPRAARDAKRRDLTLLLVSAGIMLPIGVWLLASVSPEVFRYAVSLISFALVACLVFGLRYRGPLNTSLVSGAGGAAGFLGGIAGLPGPPVILLYMASEAGAARVRATTMLFLVGFDVLLLVTYLLTGKFEFLPFGLGLCLAIPNGLGVLLGQMIFDPSKEALYRNIAYLVVICAAIFGLPIWD